MPGQARGIVKGFDLNRADLLMGNLMLGHEIGGGIDAWMGPPATGVGLVMGVAHQFPSLAQALPMWPLTG